MSKEEDDNVMLAMLFGMEGSPQETRDTILKAPFGWPGGKSRSVKEIVPRLPKSRIYVEAFGGSGSVLLNKEPVDTEVFNDRYGGVVDFYRVIRDPELKDQLYERLQMAIYAREEFCWTRETWEHCTGVERAARWFYMMNASFAGLGRNYGRATVTGKPPVDKIFKEKYHLSELHQRLKRVQFENQDWERCCLDFDTTETVHYLDPPYVATAPGTYKFTLGIHDHEQLLIKIRNLKGFVALSGYSCSLYDEQKWDAVYSWRSVVTMNAKVRHDDHDSDERSNADKVDNHHGQEMLYILHNQFGNV